MKAMFETNFSEEEYRERITHMISHTLWIGFQSPNGIKRQLKILNKDL